MRTQASSRGVNLPAAHTALVAKFLLLGPPRTWPGAGGLDVFLLCKALKAEAVNYAMLRQGFDFNFPNSPTC